MCGIVGVFNQRSSQPVEAALLEAMMRRIRYRGPDECGIYQDAGVGLGNMRLSIIDLSTGQQPIGNEDGTAWIVFNGEIFNYVELMADLQAREHVFATTSDTEVILHLYEEYGAGCLDRMIGQFAFAIWDARRRQLFLARDRVGIRPLYYTRTGDGALVFASEIKAILEHPGVTRALDPLALDQVFTFWSTLTPRTAFKDIEELPPGHYLLAEGEQISVQPFWRLTFPPANEVPAADLDETLAQYRALLQDAVRLRLRADVPVAAYLSGGIDSCTTCDFILRYTHSDLLTFSIGFADAQFDETHYQLQAADHLGTQHTSIRCDDQDIARAFPAVIWHTEIPILRTAPVPMYLLSRLVRQNNIKVVVTGEGADETLGGYNIFRETLARRFWARQPESAIRPLLLTQLYPYLTQMSRAGAGGLGAFFGYRLTDTGDPLYSHLLRWHNTSRAKQFFSPDLRAQMNGYDAAAEVRGRLPADFARLSPLAKAQYLETTIFMSSYLLSSQGDRVTAANSVEGRYPFLDHRLVEFCAALPAHFKIKGLTEKYLLKRLMKDHLPANIVNRHKQPYRAPISSSLVGPAAPDFVPPLLTEQALAATGFFTPGAVTRLLNKARSDRPLSETEAMALVGIISTQLVQHLFIDAFDRQPSAGALPPLRRVVQGQAMP